jgi:hypothetical protein
MTQYKQNIPQATDLISVSQVDLLDNFTYLDTFLNVEHQQSGRDTAAVGSGRHRTVSMPNQALATILSVVPSVSPTTINTVAPHGFSTGDSVFIRDITGTTSRVLNHKSFIITVTGVSSFTVAVSTAGLTYTGGGLVGFNPAIPAGTTGIAYDSMSALMFRNASGVFNLTNGGFATAGPSGYLYQTSNFIFQYGTVNSTTSGTVTFPINYSLACLAVITNGIFTGANPNGAAGIAIKTPLGATSFDWVFNSNSSQYSGFSWIALGL